MATDECESRSRYYKQRLAHLFTSRKTIVRPERTTESYSVCSWCELRAPASEEPEGDVADGDESRGASSDR